MFTCPGCEQPINPASEICPYCGANLVPEPPTARRSKQRKGLILTLVGAVILIVAIWSMVYMVFPKPDVPGHAEAEAGAVSALREAADVLTTYEKRQGSYPDTIDQVSAAAAPAYSAAREEGYSLLYRAGPPGGDGNIHTFALLARPEYYGYANFYIDQTGIVRSTHENRDATARDRSFP